MTGKKTVLIILDGWGHGDRSKSDSIYHANTPFIDSLYKTYPNSELKTYGEYVGLPKDQMGKLRSRTPKYWAGRIVHQNLVGLILIVKIIPLKGAKKIYKNILLKRN